MSMNLSLNRIKEYKLNRTLKDYYQGQHKLHSIDGVGTVEDINHKLCQAIDRL